MGVAGGKVSQAVGITCAKVLRQEVLHFIDEKTEVQRWETDLVWCPQEYFFSPTPDFFKTLFFKRKEAGDKQ